MALVGRWLPEQVSSPASTELVAGSTFRKGKDMSKDVMSKIRDGEVWREFLRVFREYRIDVAHDVTVTDRRPHPVLSVTHCGLTRTMTFSGTPGSRFTGKNEAMRLRQLLKDMQLAAVSTMPTVPAVERAPVKAITFRGVEIDTVMHDGEPHVALKPIVEGMGLDWNGQYQRAMRDSVLSTCMCVTHMQVGGQRRDVALLPLKILNGFLFGIDDSRVRSELRDGVIAYKRECYDALAKYWLHGSAVRVDPVPAQTAQIYSMSREDKDALGSIVKGIVIKQVTTPIEARFDDFRAEVLALIEASKAVQPVAAPDFVTAQVVIVDMAGVPFHMRYAGLAAWVSHSLVGFSAEHGAPVNRVAGSPLSFDRAAATQWLQAGGSVELWCRCNSRNARKRLRVVA